MDAIEFSKTHIKELKLRLSKKGKSSDKEVAQKFLDDQGHTFENTDLTKILGLIKGGELNNG